MSSTAVEKIPAGGVPALAPTPASTITFEDIAPPTLYVAQRTSAAVDANLANFGDCFIAQGAEDPEPTVLWQTESSEPGVLFYPLHMYKTWTHSDGETLTSWPFGDGTPPPEAPEGTTRTYNYVLYVPEYDTEMPVNFRLNSKSQRPAANKINLTVSRSGMAMHASAFRVTTVKKSSGPNKWAVPVIVEVDADAKQVQQAEQLFGLILPGLQARAAQRDATASQPSI